MKKFFLEVIKRLLMGLLISIILLIASYSFFANEFPPNLNHMRKGIFSLREQVQNIKRLQELKVSQALDHDGSHSDEEKNYQEHDVEIKKILQALGFDHNQQQALQSHKKDTLNLETLEKQNIVLLRKINQLEYRINNLEKKYQNQTSQ